MATVFQKKVVNLALAQHRRFHMLRENQEPLSSQIEKYWRDIGLVFPGVQTPWSAVFISWCVKNAGATSAQFKSASAHSRFFHVAIADAEADRGVFHGRRPTEYAPKLGDILQNNRSGNSFDFDHARSHRDYASHSAIVVEVGIDHQGRYLRTVGGNETDSIGMKEVRLDTKGRVKNASGLYIAVIQALL